MNDLVYKIGNKGPGLRDCSSMIQCTLNYFLGNGYTSWVPLGYTIYMYSSPYILRPPVQPENAVLNWR